jgi:hypothetical protein
MTDRDPRLLTDEQLAEIRQRHEPTEYPGRCPECHYVRVPCETVDVLDHAAALAEQVAALAGERDRLLLLMAWTNPPTDDPGWLERDQDRVAMALGCLDLQRTPRSMTFVGLGQEIRHERNRGVALARQEGER